MEPLLEPDWEERGALINATADEERDGAEEVVAVANYVRLRDRTIAEAAFAVADEHQRRGIGTRLLEQLAARAAGVGIERFVAEVLPANRDMLGVFEAAGFELNRELASGESRCSSPINADRALRDARGQRDHTAVVASLGRSSSRAAWPVVGASRRRGSIGGELFRNVLEGDFAGAAYPVNREGEPVADVRGYRSIEEIPDEVDWRSSACPPLPSSTPRRRRCGSAIPRADRHLRRLRRGGQRRDRAAGAAALARPRARRTADRPERCLGIAVAGPSNATFAARSAPSGNISFSSQSGALGLALLEAAEARGLGLSAFVSIGNKADVSTNDLLEWWEEDEATELVLMYVESFGNPRHFGRLARRIAREAGAGAEERDERDRPARGKLAHGGARRLGRGRGRALSPRPA